MEDIFDIVNSFLDNKWKGKYSTSEVITPTKIVADMVDLLPTDVFNKDSRFLDPAVKSGRFLAEIYRRLMDSEAMKQAFPDEQARERHILDNQLYGFATSAVAATIVRKALYGDPIELGNIRYSTDKHTVKEVQGAYINMKFDVVIGNPPYNDGMDLDFVDAGFELSTKYCVMITPAKWQTAPEDQRVASKMNYGRFRKKLVPHISHLCFYPCCKDIFDILQVDGICYYIMDKKLHESCVVENRSKHIPEFNSTNKRNICDRQTLVNIGNEIIEFMGDYSKYNFGFLANKKYRVWTNTQVPGGGLSTLVAPRKTQFVGISEVVENGQFPSSGMSCISFEADTLEECESFKSWLYCKFTRFFVAINSSKLTGIISNDSFRFVPAPVVLDTVGNRIPGKFDHTYTDEELYKAFNLPQKYIDVIEAIVKERK